MTYNYWLCFMCVQYSRAIDGCVTFDALLIIKMYYMM